MLNVTEVAFCGLQKVFVDGLYQWDYGQYLTFPDLSLPDTYETHFAQADETCTVLGGSDGVRIPDAYLQNAEQITAYIYLHEGADDGETEYVVGIPVLARPEPSEGTPTPVEQDAITQAIAALNTAVSESSQSASDAEQSARDAAQSAQDAAESAASIDMSNYATKAELQSEENARSLADTSLGNALASEIGRASQAEEALRASIPNKTSQLQNDSGFLTQAVTSVNGQTGAVTISTATTSANGLMSSTDKSRLDALYADYSSALSALGV